MKNINQLLDSYSIHHFDQIIRNMSQNEGKENSSSYHVRDLKEKSLDYLKQHGLPNKSETYRYTFLKRVYDTIAKTDNDLFSTILEGKVNRQIPHISTLNNKVDLSHTIEILLMDGVPIFSGTCPEGVSVKNINALEAGELTSIGEMSKCGDGFVKLNDLFFNDAIHITVKTNARLKKPLLIKYIHNGSSVSFGRIFLNIAPCAEVEIIEVYEVLSTQATLLNIVSEVNLHQGAKASINKIQTGLSRNFSCVDHLFVNQEKDSHLTINTVTFGNNLFRNNLNITSNGTGCESNMYGLYLAEGESHIDNQTIIDHRHPNTYSNQLYKGIMKDKGTGVFNGKIYVQPQAQKTNAFQSNKNIMLSKTANIFTKPQLEIWADDVKCSHGCTLGELEDDQLFYLRARGLNKVEAKALLLKAFASEIISRFPKNFRSFLDNQLIKRLITK